MNALKKDSAEKALEKVAEKKPVSVYSVNFNRVINNFTEKRPVAKRKVGAGEMTAQRSVSGKVFRWRNAVAVAAILAIGIFHFAFQMSFIRGEISENRPAVDVPPVKIEAPRAAPVETNSVEFDVKKIDAVLPPKTAPAIRQRPAEIAPFKPQSKKKEAVESRAERLRRAERILTGI